MVLIMSADPVHGKGCEGSTQLYENVSVIGLPGTATDKLRVKPIYTNVAGKR